jgi:hypothetical protein
MCAWAVRRKYWALCTSKRGAVGFISGAETVRWANENGFLELVNAIPDGDFGCTDEPSRWTCKR